MKIFGFHFSNKKFVMPELSYSLDVGFHFGTVEQAMFRMIDNKCFTGTDYFLDNNYVYIVEVDVELRNLIKIKDVFGDLHDDEKIINEITTNCFPTFERDLDIEYNDSKYFNIHTSIRTVLVRDYGIFLVEYDNLFEGSGKSYVILDNKIISRFERKTLREFFKEMQPTVI